MLTNKMLTKVADALDTYLAAAVADASLGVVDAAELPWGNALDRVVGLDYKRAALIGVLIADGALHEVVHVTYLELDGVGGTFRKWQWGIS